MKLLLIHPFGIGDVIFSLAAAEALHQRGHAVDYLCNERTEELLRLCPPVRRIHQFHRDAMRDELKRSPLSALKKYNALRQAIKSEQYDAVLDFSMGREYAFLAWCAGVRRRIGWDWKGRGRWLTEKIVITGFDDRSPRDFAMDLARLADPAAGKAAHYPRLKKAAESTESERWANRLIGKNPHIVLAPGGGESWGADAHYKRWSQESWSRLAQMLLADTRATLVIVGSRAEEALVRTVALAESGLPNPRIVAAVGEPLEHVLALLSGSRAFVGTDGGLLHLANLAGAPCVGIYGPVSEIGYAPLNTASPCRTVMAGVECRPCYRSFKFTGCAHQKQCLTRIAPQDVAESIRTLLTSESL